MPDDGGNGLALRSGLFLDAYARDHDVDLVMLPTAGPPRRTDFARERCNRIEVIPLPSVLDAHASLIVRVIDPGARAEAWTRFSRPSICCFNPQIAWRALVGLLDPFSYDLVHVQRLFSAPLIDPLLDREDRPPVLLDLDDEEVEFYDRLAALHKLRGEAPQARIAASDAQKFSVMGQRYLPAFDRVLVCSERGRARLAARYPDAAFLRLPNAAPPHAPADGRAGKSTDLLLVGNLSYIPNIDAAEWLVREVLPLLEGASLTLAGSSAREVETLGDENRLVRIAGKVPDLAPYYAASSIAVAPLRTGGGTRIKILEAFAHGVPVVATHLGAEGLDVEDGVHLLLADDPVDFAAQCRRLLVDPAFARSLAQNASSWLTRHATPEIVVGEIRRIAYALRRSGDDRGD
jgi:glycosyltransferase involved in cell wall biosynthesis